MTDFYKLPFILTLKQKIQRLWYNQSIEIAKPYCRRLYLCLDFIYDLNLNPLQLDLKAVYTPTSLAPILLVDDKTPINNYITLGLSESEESLAKKESKPISLPPANSIMIGYRHFDKWKFEDGSQIGDLRSDKESGKTLKLQRLIQRQVLGWKYWLLRGLGRI